MSKLLGIILVITLSVVVGCNSNLETESVEKDIETDIKEKLNENIGVMPHDFQPYNADFSWTESAWKNIQEKMDALLLNLELQGEIEPYTPKKYVAASYENMVIYIAESNKPEEQIYLEYNNKYYLFNSNKTDARSVLDIVK